MRPSYFFAGTAEAAVLEKGRAETQQPHHRVDLRYDRGATKGYGTERNRRDGNRRLRCNIQLWQEGHVQVRHLRVGHVRSRGNGLRSNKVFRYAEGNLGVADEVKHLPFDVREAKEIHTRDRGLD